MLWFDELPEQVYAAHVRCISSLGVPGCGGVVAALAAGGSAQFTGCIGGSLGETIEALADWRDIARVTAVATSAAAAVAATAAAAAKVAAATISAITSAAIRAGPARTTSTATCLGGRDQRDVPCR